MLGCRLRCRWSPKVRRLVGGPGKVDGSAVCMREGGNLNVERETYFSGALDVLCVAGDEAWVLHVVASGGLLRHVGYVWVIWKVGL